MSAELNGILHDPLIQTEYQQATSLNWDYKPYERLGNQSHVSWQVSPANILQNLNNSRDGNMYIPEQELLEYLGLSQLPERLMVNQPGMGKRERNKTLIDYYLALSQITQKQISVFRSSRGFSQKEFLLRMDPEMTLQSRVEKMQKLASQAVNALQQDDNVSEIWLTGSLATRSNHPMDVDLAVLTYQEMKTFGVQDDGERSTISALPFMSCKGRGGNPFTYLQSKTLNVLNNAADQAGIFLDCIVLTAEKFAAPKCCILHQNFVANVKENGELLTQ